MPSVTLMTGASGGLGSVVLPMFLEAGHQVAAVAKKWPRRRPAAGNCLVLTADLAKPVAARDVVRQTVKRFGRLDCLVHLIGAWVEGKRVEETTDAMWNSMMDTNARAAFHMIRETVRPMRKAGGGRIVVVGSTAAVQPVVTWSAFSASMGALSALVRVAAAELRKDRISVNLLHPSTINTDFVRAYLGEEQAPNWVDPRAMGSLMLWLCSEHGVDVSGSEIVMPARERHPWYEWPGVAELKEGR
jgi:NAD(P)-dependent dehydrogenase (short-subunit alcohol dehydrogenase family)